MSRIIVSGAEIPPSKDPKPGILPVTPQRLNIVNLIKNDKQWSLYIQALTLLQKQKHEDPLSWFAVSAIHGSPTDLVWEGAPRPGNSVYCVHGRPHFPTWHRPYLALYEQALQAAAIQAAENYKTDPDAWHHAALTLRAPYWDWADSATYLPPRQVYDSLEYKNLTITGPDGPKVVPNPLLTYMFQRKIDGGGLSQHPQTVRHPHTDHNTSIKAFEADVNEQARYGDLSFECWRTLNLAITWNQFSNGRAAQHEGGRANSLETLHNWMHIRTGGRGHMSRVPVAAFDPIFMLHHVNVDRQLALWQTLHPEVWISQEHQPEFVNNDLLPFRKDDEGFHRSTDDPVRDFVRFRATYPEFVGLENLSTDERKARIQATVDALYDPKNRRRAVAVRLAPSLPSAEASTASDVVVKATAFGAEASTGTHRDVNAAPHAHTGNALQYLDWFARIRVKKFQLLQGFTVLIFFDSVPDDVAQWRSSPHLVGSHSEFVNSDPEHCVNCTENADLITEGFIQLDDALERLGLDGRSETEIEEYIHKHIHWRIQKVDGTVVAAEELEVLEVAVMTWDVTGGEIDVRPVHHNVTFDQAGGRVPGHKTYHL